NSSGVTARSGSIRYVVATAWQSRGRRFDPVQPHHHTPSVPIEKLMPLCIFKIDGEREGARRPLTSRGTRKKCAPSREFRLEPNSVWSICSQVLSCCRLSRALPRRADMPHTSRAGLHGLCALIAVAALTLRPMTAAADGNGVPLC